MSDELDVDAMALELIRSRQRLSAARREHIQKVEKWKDAVRAGKIKGRFPILCSDDDRVMHEVWDDGDVCKMGGGDA